MHVLHIPYSFYPDAVGGTEVYVASLIEALNGEGIRGSVAAPASANYNYQYKDISVFRYAVGNPTLLELYGEGDTHAVSNFENVLDIVRPDVVHMQAHTSAVSLLVAKAVKARGLPLVLTYHTPTVSCMRGTMMLWGHQPCDGVLYQKRCTACAATAHGVPEIVAPFMTTIPAFVGKAIAKAGKTGSLWLALQYSTLVDAHLRAVLGLFDHADQIIAVCQWISDALYRNGVAAQKITINRQGVAVSPTVTPPTIFAKEGPNDCRFLYLGRVDNTKGLDTIIHAVRLLPPTSKVALDIYGIIQPGNEKYARTLQTLSADDSRIHWRPPVASEQVGEVLQNYDALLVPSRGLETGPLVVLEAFAAGIPVIGSRLGGIAELVTDGQDGILLPPNDIAAWRDILLNFSTNDVLRTHLYQGIQPPRTMQQVGHDMAHLYRKLQ